MPLETSIKKDIPETTGMDFKDIYAQIGQKVCHKIIEYIIDYTFTVFVQAYSQIRVTKCGIYTLVCFGDFLLVQSFVNFIIEQGAFMKFGSMALPYIFFMDS